MLQFWVALSLGPLIGKYHRRPDVAIRLLAQAAHAGKWHVRPGDHDALACKRWQQLVPRRCSSGVVDVKDHCNVGMTQLDKLLMNRIAPKQDSLSL
jgi:hypothetical protein